MIKSNVLKTNILKAILVLSAVVITVSFQNCSGYQSSNKSSLQSMTNAPAKAEEDKRPLLSCTIIDSTGRAIRRISNISNSDETSALIAEGDAVTFDCSQSLDYTGSYNIKNFSVNFGEGFVNSTTGIYQYTFRTANTYTIEFRLKDNQGNELVKIIRVLVKCSAMTGSSLSINANAINITNNVIPGFFSYSAQGAVSGGKAPYNYAWDFNGDSIIDNQPMDASYQKWQVWSEQSTSIPVHNLYSNLRRINLTIKDACNFTKTISKDVQFDIPRVLPAEFPPIKEYYYLQADVRRTSSPSLKNSINRATGVDFNSIGHPSAPDIGVQEHVICRYSRDKDTNKAGLDVFGQNVYGNYALTESNQAMGLAIRDIADTGILGVAVNMVTYPLQNMSYDIAQSQEVLTSYRFDQNAACSMTIMVERGETNMPCPNEPTIKLTQVSMRGTGSCGNLENNYAGAVSAENIKFFCTQMEYNRCPPGVVIGGPDPIGY